MEFFLKQKWRLKMSMKPQNTKRAVKVLPVQKDDYLVWDEELSQLGRRIRKSRETWIAPTRVGAKLSADRSGPATRSSWRRHGHWHRPILLNCRAGRLASVTKPHWQNLPSGFWLNVEANGNRQPNAGITTNSLGKSCHSSASEVSPTFAGATFWIGSASLPVQLVPATGRWWFYRHSCVMLN